MTQRLLLIAYHFPPLNSVASLRTYAFAKYLAEEGFRVTVLTAAHQAGQTGLRFDLENAPFAIRCVSGPAEGSAAPGPSGTASRGKQAKKCLAEHVIGNLATSADAWFAEARTLAHRIVAEEGTEVVLSTFSPISSHLIARGLKKRWPKLFWVADYRDLWARNLGAPRPIFPFDQLQKGVERWLHRRVDLLTTVSPPLRDELASRSGRPAVVVENGYLPEDALTAEDCAVSLPCRHTFVYTGSIYRGRRDPAPFLAALGELLAEGALRRDEVEVRFYGENSHLLRELVDATGTEDIVRLLPLVSRDASLALQRQATAILFLECNDIGSRGNLTGKLFEHLVSGTPIIGVGIDHRHAAGQVITATNTGFVCGTDVGQIKAALRAVMDGRISQPNREKIAAYRRDRLVAKLAREITTRLSADTNPPVADTGMGGS